MDWTVTMEVTFLLVSIHPQNCLLPLKIYHQLKKVISWRHSKTDSNRNSSPVINYVIIFRRFCKLTKSDYYFHHVCLSIRPSVRPHETTRLQLDGFLLNFYFITFKNISKNSSFIKSRRHQWAVFYMNTYVYL